MNYYKRWTSLGLVAGLFLSSCGGGGEVRVERDNGSGSEVSEDDAALEVDSDDAAANETPIEEEPVEQVESDPLIEEEFDDPDDGLIQPSEEMKQEVKAFAEGLIAEFDDGDAEASFERLTSRLQNGVIDRGFNWERDFAARGCYQNAQLVEANYGMVSSESGFLTETTAARLVFKTNGRCGDKTTEIGLYHTFYESGDVRRSEADPQRHLLVDDLFIS